MRREGEQDSTDEEGGQASERVHMREGE